MEQHTFTCPNEECKGSGISIEQELFNEGVFYCQYCGSLLVIEESKDS